MDDAKWTVVLIYTFQIWDFFSDCSFAYNIENRMSILFILSSSFIYASRHIIGDAIVSTIPMKEQAKNSEIKYLPDNFFSPTMTVVFGDYTAIFVWEEPYQAILIRSKALAQSYNNYFNGLWQIAKE